MPVKGNIQSCAPKHPAQSLQRCCLQLLMYLRILKTCVQQLYATAAEQSSPCDLSTRCTKACPVFSCVSSNVLPTVFQFTRPQRARQEEYRHRRRWRRGNVVLTVFTANPLSFHETDDTAVPFPRLSPFAWEFTLAAPLFSRTHKYSLVSISFRL
jgi:hypothetical protein